MKRVFLFIAILLLLVSAGVLGYNRGARQIEPTQSNSILRFSADTAGMKNPSP